MKTYLRKEARRHGSSLQVTSTKLEHDISAFESRIKGHMPTMGGMA